MSRLSRPACLFFTCVMLATVSAKAVILYSTPTRNGTPDPSSVAYPGWQLQGQWVGELATPIAPDFFIAAQHIGGSSGDTFTYQGTNYTIDSSFGTGGAVNVPNSDLRIWKVTSSFPTWAPLYTKSDEVGKHLVVYGRGTPRGSDVTLAGQLKGWQWAAYDGVQSWGENDVSSIAPFTGLGDMLKFTFDAGTLPNECTLSAGDSSGGLFIQDGGVWKLAGINYGVDGPYSTSSTGSNSFNAALFDKSGYFEEVGAGTWQFNTPTGQNIPAASYSSRISSNAAFIESVIPEPASGLMLVVGLVMLGVRRRV